MKSFVQFIGESPGKTMESSRRSLARNWLFVLVEWRLLNASWAEALWPARSLQRVLSQDSSDQDTKCCPILKLFFKFQAGLKSFVAVELFRYFVSLIDCEFIDLVSTTLNFSLKFHHRIGPDSSRVDRALAKPTTRYLRYLQFVTNKT